MSAVNSVQSDAELAALLRAEIVRAQHQLSMIASENIVSEDVLAALGSSVVNKTVEGVPGRRFHAGSAIADKVEELAVCRAKQLFGGNYASVQPHSGTQANQAAFAALLRPGDRILAMALADGGHLSHGSKVSLAGAIYDVSTYHVSEANDQIDLNQVRDLARTSRPQVIVAGGSSYPRDIDYEGFASIAREIGARLLVDCAHLAGLIAGRVVNDPIPHSDVVTMSTYKTLRGPRGGLIIATDLSLGASIDRGVFPSTQGTPAVNVLAAKAVCLREAKLPEFSDYARRCVLSAKMLADELLSSGIRLVSGHTDTAMVLVDLREAPIAGDLVARRLESIGLLVNRNLVPRDPRRQAQTSGIRISTASLMSRGAPVDAVCALAPIISACCRESISHQESRLWADQVKELCGAWPLLASGARRVNMSTCGETLYEVV